LLLEGRDDTLFDQAGAANPIPYRVVLTQTLLRNHSLVNFAASQDGVTRLSTPKCRTHDAPLRTRSLSATWPPKHIPCLDGLRAVSILLVIVSHLVLATPHITNEIFRTLLIHGGLGVQIFFVISGFLITTLLFDERHRTGTISLGLFYLRRSIRIVPAFALFLSIIAILNYLGLVTLPPHNLLYAITYTVNFNRHGTWLTAHLWSLSVEEQFYLVWPALVGCVSRSAALASAASVFVLSPIVLGVLTRWHSPLSDVAAGWFPLVADSIAAGCLTAAIVDAYHSSQLCSRILSARWGVVVPFLIFAVDCTHRHPRFFFPYGQLFVNVGIAYCVARFALLPDVTCGRTLNHNWLRWLGGLSYSLYLWQQPFLNPFVNAIWTTFPVNLICAFGMASMSYYLLERPLQGLRRRFQARDKMHAPARDIDLVRALGAPRLQQF
jgi:peptidoglycan/LPS O-acetylase OafA/YrhL